MLESASEPEDVVEVPFGFDEVLGRDPSAGVTIADPGVSRRHARVVHDDSGIWIADVGSTNGTFLNGAPLTSPTLLRDGDQLKLGDSFVLFRNVAPVAVTAGDEDATTVFGAPVTAEHQAHPIERETLDLQGSLSVREVADPWGQLAGQCGKCGSEDVSGRWFCGRCGDQLKAFTFPPVAGEAFRAQEGFERVVTRSGKVRRLPLRRFMRQYNGGQSPRFDAPLSTWTIVFRGLLIALLLAAIVVGVAVAGGAVSTHGVHG